MNFFDFIIASIIVFFLIRGVFRGIIKEASSIIGVLAGLYAAFTYYSQVGRAISIFGISEKYMNIIGFLLLFTVVLLMVGALGILIRFVLKIVFLSWADRFFGGVFGFIRGFLIAAVVVFTLTTFLPRGTPFIRESKLTPYVAKVAGTISGFTSHALRTKYNENINAAKTNQNNHDRSQVKKKTSTSKYKN